MKNLILTVIFLSFIGFKSTFVWADEPVKKNTGEYSGVMLYGELLIECNKKIKKTKDDLTAIENCEYSLYLEQEKLYQGRNRTKFKAGGNLSVMQNEIFDILDKMLIIRESKVLSDDKKFQSLLPLKDEVVQKSLIFVAAAIKFKEQQKNKENVVVIGEEGKDEPWYDSKIALFVSLLEPDMKKYEALEKKLETNEAYLKLVAGRAALYFSYVDLYDILKGEKPKEQSKSKVVLTEIFTLLEEFNTKYAKEESLSMRDRGNILEGYQAKVAKKTKEFLKFYNEEKEAKKKAEAVKNKTEPEKKK